MNARRFASWVNLLIAAVLALAVWVLLVWTASRPAFKTLIDLTPQAVNSVDPATEELLAELREQKCQLEFHLFLPPVSGQARDEATAQWLAIQARVRDLTRLLLRRYVWLGGENTKLIEHDMYGDPASTREAMQRFGITEAIDTVVVSLQLPGKERRFKKLSLMNDLADIELPELRQAPVPGARMVVPTLKDFLGEIRLSSAMKALLVQGVPIAYFCGSYSPDNVDLTNTSVGRSYGLLLDRLRALGFEVRQLNLSRQKIVPSDAALVAVLEPRLEFPDLDAQALYDYLQRGGRLFVNYTLAGLEDWNTDGGKLGELLGYEIGKRPVYHLIRDVTGQARGPGLDGNIGVSRLQLNADGKHEVTRRIAQSGRTVEVEEAREIKERGAPEGVIRQVLLWTGPYGWLAEADADGGFNTRAPKSLRAMVEGMSIEVPNKVAGERAGKAIVVSGKFCNNSNFVQSGDLALNIFNWMAERSVLLDIQANRYRVRAMDLQPQQLGRTGNLLLFGVPGLFLVLGFAVFFMRRRQ